MPHPIGGHSWVHTGFLLKYSTMQRIKKGKEYLSHAYKCITFTS